MNGRHGPKLVAIPALALAAWLCLACSGSDGQGSMYGSSCEPGETRACTCPDGSKSQKVCGETGSGYHPCSCGDVAIVPSDVQDDDTSTDTTIPSISRSSRSGEMPDSSKPPPTHTIADYTLQIAPARPDLIVDGGFR